jgi:hypothetical protein
MKVDPAMYMKTQETMTKCPAIKQVFTRKCTHCAIIDTHLSGFWPKMHSLRNKSGRSWTQNRLIGPSIHRRSAELVLDDPMIRWPDSRRSPLCTRNKRGLSFRIKMTESFISFK